MKRAALLVLFLLVAARPARAEKPTRLVDVPCTGCRAVIPKVPAGTKVPLLVLLHGDWGAGPAEMINAWERHVSKQDVALLALQCPKDLGCKGSFWQWNGDPAWVTKQVDALGSKEATIDRERMYLAGWSGGATYIGMRAQAFQRTFAALVYHGGGVSPGGGCVGGERAAAAFLVGGANPFHHHVVQLRGHHEACGDDVLWKLVPKGDHAQEWSALDTNGSGLVEWMLKKRLARTT